MSRAPVHSRSRKGNPVVRACGTAAERGQEAQGRLGSRAVAAVDQGKDTGLYTMV